MLNLPSANVHMAPETWGPTAHLLHPRRSLTGDKLNADSNMTKDQETLQKQAYLPFGGGRHLYPGRHYVFAEALDTIAALLLGYEITGEDGGTLKMSVMRL